MHTLHQPDVGVDSPLQVASAGMSLSGTSPFWMSPAELSAWEVRTRELTFFATSVKEGAKGVAGMTWVDGTLGCDGGKEPASLVRTRGLALFATSVKEAAKGAMGMRQVDGMLGWDGGEESASPKSRSKSSAVVRARRIESICALTMRDGWEGIKSAGGAFKEEIGGVVVMGCEVEVFHCLEEGAAEGRAAVVSFVASWALCCPAWWMNSAACWVGLIWVWRQGVWMGGGETYSDLQNCCNV